MATSKNLTNLTINKVDSQETYDKMVDRGLINEDELYLVQGDEVSGVQSDWEQNDSEELDYVKNRTHYKEEIFVEDELVLSGDLEDSDYIVQAFPETYKTYEWSDYGGNDTKKLIEYFSMCMDNEDLLWTVKINNCTYTDLKLSWKTSVPGPMVAVVEDSSALNINFYLMNDAMEEEEITQEGAFIISVSDRAYISDRSYINLYLNSESDYKDSRFEIILQSHIKTVYKEIKPEYLPDGGEGVGYTREDTYSLDFSTLAIYPESWYEEGNWDGTYDNDDETPNTYYIDYSFALPNNGEVAIEKDFYLKIGDQEIQLPYNEKGTYDTYIAYSYGDMQMDWSTTNNYGIAVMLCKNIDDNDWEMDITFRPDVWEEISWEEIEGEES